jgi:hypothetical protein
MVQPRILPIQPKTWLLSQNETYSFRITLSLRQKTTFYPLKVVVKLLMAFTIGFKLAAW